MWQVDNWLASPQSIYIYVHDILIYKWKSIQISILKNKNGLFNFISKQFAYLFPDNGLF